MGSWLPSIFRSVDDALEPKPISTAVCGEAASGRRFPMRGKPMRSWFTFRRVDEALEPKPKSTAIIQLGRAWRAFLWVWRVLRRHPVLYGVTLLAMTRALASMGNPVAQTVSIVPCLAAIVLLSIAWSRFVDRHLFPKHR